MAVKRRKRLDRKTLIVLGAALGLQTLVCLGLVVSIHSSKSLMERKLASKETTLTNVRLVSAGLPALQKQFATTQARMQHLEASLPPSDYIPTLLSQVAQTAEQDHVSIKQFRPKSGPPPSASTPATTGPQQQQFDLSVSGNYMQIQHFLASLTDFRKILAVNTVNLKPAKAPQKDHSPDLVVDLGLTAYLLPPDPAPAVPPPALKKATANAGQIYPATHQG